MKQLHAFVCLHTAAQTQLVRYAELFTLGDRAVPPVNKLVSRIDLLHVEVSSEVSLEDARVTVNLDKIIAQFTSYLIAQAILNRALC